LTTNKKSINSFASNLLNYNWLSERVGLRKKLILGQSSIDLNDSQTECKHPDFPIIGVDVLLQ
jgi:hypothetical protein